MHKTIKIAIPGPQAHTKESAHKPATNLHSSLHFCNFVFQVRGSDSLSRWKQGIPPQQMDSWRGPEDVMGISITHQDHVQGQSDRCPARTDTRCHHQDGSLAGKLVDVGRCSLLWNVLMFSVNERECASVLLRTVYVFVCWCVFICVYVCLGVSGCGVRACKELEGWHCVVLMLISDCSESIEMLPELRKRR